MKPETPPSATRPTFTPDEIDLIVDHYIAKVADQQCPEHVREFVREAFHDVLRHIALPSQSGERDGMMKVGHFHCACTFHRPGEWEKATLIEECAYHKTRREELEAKAAPSSTREPVAWMRIEDGIRVYYETEAWPDMTPLYAAPSAIGEKKP